MTIVRHNNASAAAKFLAPEIIHLLQTANDPFLILPGGTSPVSLLQELAALNVDWNNIVITTTDERCVSSDSNDNNSSQIVNYLGSLPKLIRLWENGSVTSLPSLTPSVCVLGMGTDGHFASLFPGMAFDDKQTEPYEVLAPKPPSRRITLPVQIFMQSQRIILLANGKQKVKLIDDIIQGLHSKLPIAMLIARRPDIQIHASL